MALDLEEQEQVAELKAWWTQHGNRILAVLFGESSNGKQLELHRDSPAHAYDAHYEALKADAMVGKSQLADARAAYQSALEKAERRDSPFRESEHIRLEALGG